MVGVFVGYALYNIKDQKMKIPLVNLENDLSLSTYLSTYLFTYLHLSLNLSQPLSLDSPKTCSVSLL